MAPISLLEAALADRGLQKTTPALRLMCCTMYTPLQTTRFLSPRSKVLLCGSQSTCPAHSLLLVSTIEVLPPM